MAIPKTERAVQLVGPSELRLNESKPVVMPGPYQVLAKVESCGLCFSDLKLLKQFSGHPRKGEISSGLDKAILKEIPSYVPGSLPTVSGHEAVVRIVAVGEKAKGCKVGDRRLVQTDYRWLPNTESNASFGYNFEGGLQEYVLMDERIITAPDGDYLLIPASDALSAAAVSLIEPWACVEDAYLIAQRRTVKPGGTMLVASDGSADTGVLKRFLGKYGKPGKALWYSPFAGAPDAGVPMTRVASLDEVKADSCDEVIYLGATPDTLEALYPKLAAKGLMLIAQGGKAFGRPVVTPVGRVHYSYVRIAGTAGSDPAEAMARVPANAELRPGEKVNIVGAAGPMGVMHAIRALCQGVKGVSVAAGDLSEERLALLAKLAAPLSKKNGVGFTTYNPKAGAPGGPFTYIVLMVPVPALVAQAVVDAGDNAIVNIFAGIAAGVSGPIDMDVYCRKGLYFIGTSGSVMEDMRVVLRKVEAGQLDTNLSVAAVCGLDGVADGVKAVETQKVPGKIVVYPQLKGLGLTTLPELAAIYPAVGAHLKDGVWNKKAEEALLTAAG